MHTPISAASYGSVTVTAGSAATITEGSFVHSSLPLGFSEVLQLPEQWHKYDLEVNNGPK